MAPLCTCKPEPPRRGGCPGLRLRAAGRALASRGGNRAHRGPPAAAEPPQLTDGAEEREPPLRATAGSFCKPEPPRRGGCPGLRLRPSASVGLQQPPRQALRRTRSGRRSQDRHKVGWIPFAIYGRNQSTSLMGMVLLWSRLRNPRPDPGPEPHGIYAFEHGSRTRSPRRPKPRLAR